MAENLPPTGAELPKTYDPVAIEEKWYAFWEANGCFTADPDSKKAPYSIVIPPPNVTGVLTLGHVLNNTIQDILARRARMQGKEVLWLPGTDHAGIATQTVVERALKKQGVIKHRDDLGREKFLEKVWEWKEKHGGIIIQQLKKLGASCDWSRERFTMDPHYSECVSQVFVDLYKKGLIYRGKRMVNWDPFSRTALSDEEVVMKPQNGTMYFFKVEVAEVTQPGGLKEISPGLQPGVAGEKTAHPGGVPETGGSVSAAPSGADTQDDVLPRVPPGANIQQPSGLPAQPGTFLTIATTRPETIPGDTAIAVNPKDERYAHLIGRRVVRPLPDELPREEKLIPIIGDEQVEFEFGTGVLKVTPAHDKTDFEIWERIVITGLRENNPELFGMKPIDIMNPDGTMNALAGEALAGLDRFEARSAAVERLRELGALVKEEPYQNNVGFSERTDVPIEPRLSEQWFLKYPSVEQARACVAQLGENVVQPAAQQPGGLTDFSPGQRPGLGTPHDTHPGGVQEKPDTPRMHFYPERWAKVYEHWMGNIRDWCISRQLWWGHRIPIWTKTIHTSDLGDLGDPQLQEELQRWLGAKHRNPDDDVDLATDDEGEMGVFYRCWWKGDGTWKIEAPAYSARKIHRLERAGFTQDPDVLDTWFSSWLWPFATMGWPVKTDTLAKFYPTTDLVTAPDIIFFWVARMIMAGFEFMGEMPFRNVYFTGIIRDKQGRKMSKSLGNSPDPLDLIGRYGADALRFGVMRSAPLGQDILFDEKNVELGRNFCTKLWNACRFRQMQNALGTFDGPPAFEGEIDPALLTSDDRWILRRLDAAIREVSTALDEYRFSDAANGLYRFFWSEFCDWYLEASKAALGRPGDDPTEATGGTESTAPNELSSASVPSATSVVPPLRRRANTLAVTDFVLGHTLRLFHPFLPFITEELWQGMGFSADLPADQGGRTIMFAHWPAPLDADFHEHYGLTPEAEAAANAKYETVMLGRGLRRDFNIASNKRVRFVLSPRVAVDAHDAGVLTILLNAGSFDLLVDYAPPRGTPVAVTPLGELFLPLEGLIDIAAERERLGKEIAKATEELAKVRAKLANPNFTEKVPASVLDEHHQRERSWAEKVEQLERMRSALVE